MKTSIWLVLGLAVILALCTGLALGAGLLGYGFPGGMMGRWGANGYPGGMMGGWGWGGLLGMGLMLLLPLGFMALVVLGAVWLAGAVSSPAVKSAPAETCPACHKGVQADWKNCPYCGNTLGS